MQAGQYITDGTVRWLVVDIRDGSMVGDITYSPILRPGHVKANGALLANASVNYPRLVSFAVDNNLTVADDAAWEGNKAAYVYDEANDTLRVPDAGGRVLQGGASVQSLEAGLPEISGLLTFRGRESGGYDIVAGANGAFNITYKNGGPGVQQTPNNCMRADVYFDASRANPIYSASQTVQPPALTQIAQIKY